ncbi:hypothetical protein [Dyadobacter sp. 676]|uniref:SBBP repeat-containing protein n=1 Tax=Dyadobacter sp. 676 TaxID=3088362 RepID=A0AAU8FFN2_9BACT
MQKYVLFNRIRQAAKWRGEALTAVQAVGVLRAFYASLLFMLLTLAGFRTQAQAQDAGLQWANGIISPAAQNARVYAVSSDASKNVYATGLFTGTVDFDPSAATANLVSAGSNDIFITKYDQNGKFIWAKRVGGTGDDRGYGIIADDAGNTYISGLFIGTVDFNPNAGVNNLVSSAGSLDPYVLKLDPNGNYLWAQRMGGGAFLRIQLQSCNRSRRQSSGIRLYWSWGIHFWSHIIDFCRRK